MRLALALVLMAACHTVPVAPPAPPAPPPPVAQPEPAPAPPPVAPEPVAPAEPPPVTPAPSKLDWPVLIGRPEAEARREIATSLDVPPKTDLTPLGVEFKIVDKKINTIFIHLQPEGGTGPVYQGLLFRGVGRDMTRDEITRLLGEPDEVGQGLNNWIKYNRPEAQIHFQFDGKNHLYMVTLMTANWTPGR